MELFNQAWVPDQDMGVEEAENAVRTIQFGNGVTQLQKTTLGSCPKIYSLTFTRKPELIMQIDEFLERHAGKRFLWEVPLENRQIIVYHSKKTLRRTGFVDTLNVTFAEVKF